MMMYFFTDGLKITNNLTEEQVPTTLPRRRRSNSTCFRWRSRREVGPAHPYTPTTRLQITDTTFPTSSSPTPVSHYLPSHQYPLHGRRNRTHQHPALPLKYSQMPKGKWLLLFLSQFPISRPQICILSCHHLPHPQRFLKNECGKSGSVH